MEQWERSNKFLSFIMEELYPIVWDGSLAAVDKGEKMLVLFKNTEKDAWDYRAVSTKEIIGSLHTFGLDHQEEN